MPRDGSGNYVRPAGTTAISGEVITSVLFETAMNDFVAVLNTTRPVSKGGTGRNALSVDVQDLLGQADYASMVAAMGISGFAPLVHTHPFSDLTALPTTLAGYGIGDAAPLVHTHTFASLTAKPTTLAGYGITDGGGGGKVLQAVLTEQSTQVNIGQSGTTLATNFTPQKATSMLRVTIAAHFTQSTSGSDRDVNYWVRSGASKTRLVKESNTSEAEIFINTTVLIPAVDIVLRSIDLRIESTSPGSSFLRVGAEGEIPASSAYLLIEEVDLT